MRASDANATKHGTRPSTAPYPLTPQYYNYNQVGSMMRANGANVTYIDAVITRMKGVNNYLCKVGRAPLLLSPCDQA